MAQAVSVRLDDEAMRALARLEATGKSRSEAIRSALVEAASRLSDKESLAAEAAALKADATDRAEMLAVAELMENLRAAVTCSVSGSQRASDTNNTVSGTE